MQEDALANEEFYPISALVKYSDSKPIHESCAKIATCLHQIKDVTPQT